MDFNKVSVLFQIELNLPFIKEILPVSFGGSAKRGT